jgi:hypothetical protein
MDIIMRGRGVALAGLSALVLATGGVVLAQGTAPTAGKGAWLHVRVEEANKQSKVSVNLPVAVVDAALQAAPESVISDGHVKLGRFGHHNRDLSVADLRRAWTELKSTGDAEFVSVEDDDETVHIARAGSVVLIRVDKAAGRDAVRVEVPIDVVDALLSGTGDELNVRAAFAKLQSRRGDIVRVKDDDSTVRIWIDEGN